MGIRVKEKVVIVVIVVFNWKQHGQQEKQELCYGVACKIHGEFMGIRVKE